MKGGNGAGTQEARQPQALAGEAAAESRTLARSDQRAPGQGFAAERCLRIGVSRGQRCANPEALKR